MREMAKETNLPMRLGAYRDGLGGLTPEAEELVVEEHIASRNEAAGSQSTDEDTLVNARQYLKTGD